MNETKLEIPKGRVSYHDSAEEMLKRIREDGMSLVPLKQVKNYYKDLKWMKFS